MVLIGVWIPVMIITAMRAWKHKTQVLPDRMQTELSFEQVLVMCPQDLNRESRSGGIATPATT